MNRNLPEELRERLAIGLPDRSLLDRFAPAHTRVWRFQPAPPDARTASVIVLLYERDGLWRFPLVLRPGHLRHHQGQVGLPGGACDPEETLMAAALRELDEELGVHPSRVETLGALSPFFVPASRFVVHPWVAWTRSTPEFRPNPAEVAELLEMPLATIIDPAALACEEREFSGQLSNVPYYSCGCYKIWGATCIVLGELATLCSDLDI